MMQKNNIIFFLNFLNKISYEIQSDAAKMVTKKKNTHKN